MNLTATLDHVWGLLENGVRRCVVCGVGDFAGLRRLIARMRRATMLNRITGTSLELWHAKLVALGLDPDDLDPWLPPEPTDCGGP